MFEFDRVTERRRRNPAGSDGDRRLISDRPGHRSRRRSASLPGAIGVHINAQIFAEAEPNSLDFVISAHVIEHLRDPMGSIVNAIRVLKPHGVHILIVPDMHFIFDRNRPETTLDHIRADFADGGAGTTRSAYEEHLRFVHPILQANTIRRLKSSGRWRRELGAGRSSTFTFTLGRETGLRLCSRLLQRWPRFRSKPPFRW